MNKVYGVSCFLAYLINVVWQCKVFIQLIIESTISSIAIGLKLLFSIQSLAKLLSDRGRLLEAWLALTVW